MLLEMRGITKTYDGGVQANRDVSFSVRAGEIHALVGENGAGKSTLMKILFGLEPMDAGEIIYKGQKVRIQSPEQALEMGIGMVHQHFMLIPSLTVAENIVLGHEPRLGGGRFDFARAVRITRELSEQYGLSVNPQARIEEISVGARQRVEILKALYRGAELLILDEPTAVLTPKETNDLFVSLKQLIDRGHTIIFITHKLQEVIAISDRVTVMRQGRTVGTMNTADTTKEAISRLMVGRDVLLRVAKPPAKPGKPVLVTNDLRAKSDKGNEILKGISLTVHAGEIVGIAGVEGNGQSEFVEILTGLRRATGGQVKIGGQDVTNWPPKDIRRLGVGHVPEDRHVHGSAGLASIAENLILDRYDQPPFAGQGLARFIIRPKAIRSFARELIDRFDIRAENELVPAGALSGGNLQKVIIAREFVKQPQLLIAAQPTRGVDIGAIEFIHQEIVRQRDNGAAVLLISADLQEVLALSDRLVVFYEGEIVAEFTDTAHLTEEEVGYYMLGAWRDRTQKGESK
ncbi:MAG: ABC transporter ATP-binding protein [Hydrogenibacillus sp.]|nr:ABC transporter ATP-binding protein [Hydrogenibacillus sp.]